MASGFQPSRLPTPLPGASPQAGMWRAFGPGDQSTPPQRRCGWRAASATWPLALELAAEAQDGAPDPATQTAVGFFCVLRSLCVLCVRRFHAISREPRQRGRRRQRLARGPTHHARRTPLHKPQSASFACFAHFASFASDALPRSRNSLKALQQWLGRLPLERLVGGGGFAPFDQRRAPRGGFGFAAEGMQGAEVDQGGAQCA